MASNAPTTGAPTRAPSLDRRALLRGAAVVPLLGSIPAVAATGSMPNRHIETLFAEWKQSIWSINHAPDLSDEAAEALWDRASRAELAVMQSPDASPRLAAIRLWMGLEAMTENFADTDAVTSEDIDSLFSRIEQHDWHVQCAMRALQALIVVSRRA